MPTWTVGHAIKAVGLFAAMMAIVAVKRAQHPFPRFGAANAVTTVRALLAALIAGFIGEPVSSSAAATIVALGMTAAALDGLDGWLARRDNEFSAFGARFDMEVDALLIQILAVLAWQHDKAGVWVLASGLLRYVFVAAGWIWRWLHAPLPPSFHRKAISAVQTVALLLTLAPFIAHPASAIIAAVGLGVLSYSFLIDTIWLWAHAR